MYTELTDRDLISVAKRSIEDYKKVRFSGKEASPWHMIRMMEKVIERLAE